MIKLGLLGNGISRSRAKSLHEMLGSLSGLEVSYQPMDLGDKQAVDIEAELRRCERDGFTGVNVTHPYKRQAFQHMQLRDAFPTGLTSVNTVLFRGEAMLAENTDYSGFCRAYRNQFGDDASPGRVLMLGAGGVGLAIAFGLHTLGASELILHDTQPSLSQAMIQSLTHSEMKVRMAGEDLIAEMQAADGLINATPVGMYQYPGNPFPAEGFTRQRWAFDAVYTPENTLFLNTCRQLNIPTLSGFRLFLYQGLDAFRHFTGVDLDAALAEREFLRQYPLAEQSQ